jgi:uncharacterized membrane protein
MLILIFALGGAMLAASSNVLLGLGAGAVIGYLVSRVAEVQRAVSDLQAALDAQRRAPRISDATASAPPQPPGQAPASPPAPSAAAAASRSDAPWQVSALGAPESAPAAPRRAPPDMYDKAWRASRRWLTTGNVPVKVGVIISFFGVAFLLRYAVDRNLLVMSIEMRLLVVAAIAGVLLAVGWRLRQRNRVYALSLQGGGIGILYLTIFAAFRLYALLPATAAFALLVILTAAGGTLAVLQNARALAILASVGGFLAPVLVSTGQGSHVALFSYYLLLNAAILGISRYRAWRSLNLIGFAFTFGLGTLWGYEYYRPELYASTQPFLILHFLFYQAIAVLFAFRQTPDLRGLVDGTILFGTPVIAFGLQAALVDDTEYGLAISAAAVAVFYVALATWLNRRHREQLRLMIESFVALGVAFATIAIPLALDARWTAAAWALEGAALVWLGVRQHGLLARLSGSALLVAAGLAFIEGGWRPDAGIAVLNGNALGGCLISAASLFGAFCLQRDTRPHYRQSVIAVVLLLWGLIWWFATGALEVADRLAHTDVLHAYTLFAAASATTFALLAHRLSWPAARQATIAYLPLLLLLGLLYLSEHGHLFVAAGWLAWPFALAAHFIVLRLYDRGDPDQEGIWHLAGTLLLTAAISIEAYWRVDDAGLNGTWAAAAALLTMLLPAWLIMGVGDRAAWPLRRYRSHYLTAAGIIIALQLILLLGAGIERPGSPAPLPYLPVLNPFDVMTLVSLAVALQFLLAMRGGSEAFTDDLFRNATKLWALAAFLLTTIAVVRGVHHLADVSWSADTLLRSVSVQGALSIYWGILGFAGMVFGARREQRKVWMIGTGLMAVVVVKLFLVDLGNTGTVARIISFLGVGGLLLVVGYLAPAPPKRLAAGESEV